MPKNTSKRLHLLDEIRGFSIICMVFFHGFYLAASIFSSDTASTLYNFFYPAEPYFAGLFILISGIASMLSRSNLKRGLILAGVSLALNIITFLLPKIGIPTPPIYFGILNLLAVCMLLIAALMPLIKKISPLIGMAVCICLYIVFMNLQKGYIGIPPLSVNLPNAVMNNPYIFPLGIYTSGFASGDYFPVIPWVFVFLFGAHLGVYAQKGKFPKFASNEHIRPLGFVGRHTLIVYIAHQPIIYGICFAISKLTGGNSI